jgi:hypothetical protein
MFNIIHYDHIIKVDFRRFLKKNFPCTTQHTSPQWGEARRGEGEGAKRRNGDSLPCAPPQPPPAGGRQRGESFPEIALSCGKKRPTGRRSLPGALQ